MGYRRMVRTRVRRDLSPARATHTKYVARCARVIARRNAVDRRQVSVAAWLHDWAREWPAEHLLQYIQLYRHPTPAERENPLLAHADVGAHLARMNYPELPDDVIDAVASHTLGRENMSPVGCALFCADYLARGRDHVSAADRRRMLALPLAKMTLAVIEHACHHGLKRHPITEKMYRQAWKKEYCA